MWVRGLKRDHVDAILWILPRSHPMWVRGLKHSLSIRLRCNHIVAPYVGAWIETVKRCAVYRAGSVAPYVGAWIETDLILSA